MTLTRIRRVCSELNSFIEEHRWLLAYRRYTKYGLSLRIHEDHVKVRIVEKKRRTKGEYVIKEISDPMTQFSALGFYFVSVVSKDHKRDMRDKNTRDFLEYGEWKSAFREMLGLKKFVPTHPNLTFHSKNFVSIPILSIIKPPDGSFKVSEFEEAEDHIYEKAVDILCYLRPYAHILKTDGVPEKYVLKILSIVKNAQKTQLYLDEANHKSLIFHKNIVVR